MEGRNEAHLIVQCQVVHVGDDCLPGFRRNAHHPQPCQLDLLCQLINCHIAGGCYQNLSKNGRSWQRIALNTSQHHTLCCYIGPEASVCNAHLNDYDRAWDGVLWSSAYAHAGVAGIPRRLSQGHLTMFRSGARGCNGCQLNVNLNKDTLDYGAGTRF